MATVTPVPLLVGKMMTWTWTGIVTGDTATPIELEHTASDLLEFCSGTFAGGTSVSFRGSLDNTNFKSSLADPGGTAIAHTAAGGSAIREGWRFISPVVASGASDSITVKLLARYV